MEVHSVSEGERPVMTMDRERPDPFGKLAAIPRGGVAPSPPIRMGMEMPETLRKSGPGNKVHFGIGVWFDAKLNCIKIQSDDAGFITTVRADPSLKRGHPNLFRKLAKVLRNNGAPAPDTGY